MNQRDDFPHKLPTFYVNSYDIVCVKDLNIKGMVRNYHLAKRCLMPLGENSFLCLSYKAERANGTFVKVNSRDTSKGLSHEDPLPKMPRKPRIRMQR